MTPSRYHHIFDLKHCNERIGDREQVRAFIEAMTKAINMTILEGPIIAAGVEQNPGWSAFAIVDLSHISVHTFTEYSEALIDVFSCQEFDRDKALLVCTEFFGTIESEVRHKEVWWG